MAFGEFSTRTPQPMAEMNTTPLVDVMLVLLVVFMLAAPLITQQINVALPKISSSGTPLKAPRLLSIDRHGVYHWDRAPQASTDALTLVVAQARASNPTLNVEIQADKRVPYDAVAQALSVLQQQGVTQISFTGQKTE